MYDRIIIGAGIYGLYAAVESAKKGYKTLVLERDSDALTRGSFINQARLHSGYHYPRSKETAQKSRDYFFRFMNDFKDAINVDFKQYYAISHDQSLTTKDDFVKFCNDLNIKCDEIDSSIYFKDGSIDGLFDTLEYSIDCIEIRDILLDRCKEYDNLEIEFNSEVVNVNYDGEFTVVVFHESIIKTYESKWLLNATYANTNSILSMLNLEPLDIKYEQCEVILCAVSKKLKNVGLTVMDGPFFSIMPFGNTGLHSLTSVCHTPHITSYDKYPIYDCQLKSPSCNGFSMENCNTCELKPKSKAKEMMELASNYLTDDIKITPIKSLFTIKPILNSCEKDDARPTLVKTYREIPNFITVFSGKLNTMYDLDEVL